MGSRTSRAHHKPREAPPHRRKKKRKREEALKQKKSLSLELATLRDELVASAQCCERLQQGREELRVRLEEALQRLQQQHQEQLVQLEDRLRSFYQTEWDKVHQTYQEEADRWRTLMEQQVEELRSRHEAERKDTAESHSQKMESLRGQHETSTQELKRIQHTELENLNTSLKDTETSLSEKVSGLCAEKEALSEKLGAEEERRKQTLTDKNLKNSHTVYLEQELDSLKVVLELKNNQLHQKEKKLMDMDKLAALQRTGQTPADAAEGVQGQQAPVYGERGAALEAAQWRPAGQPPPPLPHLTLRLTSELCLLPHSCTLIAQITPTTSLLLQQPGQGRAVPHTGKDFSHSSVVAY
ncbi:microtubule-associated tumor suppressor 1 homolog A isoform X2 [Pseudochaenichthys georgianus]|uniref:microtubule-associated tumor suppressor 1 homolog A isoform X2 n=1 Tax=Pseudochaenichthys georgianus TaxID=52239 RepID=UPI00146C89AA|nr:microtubule-associated tumor suppressor 1 homolog A isoform X2 [Pseudochaenichthys georgianus]